MERGPVGQTRVEIIVNFIVLILPFLPNFKLPWTETASPSSDSAASESDSNVLFPIDLYIERPVIICP